MLSAFVVTYNRPALLSACLKAVRFVDELIVIDKSSPGPETEAVARDLADKYIKVPWTPTVEETRTHALSLCSGDWIICLDDDEILSEPCGTIFREIADDSTHDKDVFAVPMRHYILGKHDQRAWYWPDYRFPLFRRGSVVYQNVVHAGVVVLEPQNVVQFPEDGSAFIRHVSCENISEWIEKANRYSDAENRVGVALPKGSLADFARRCLDHWCGMSQENDPYIDAVAVLKAIAEMIDGLKRWERGQGLA